MKSKKILFIAIAVMVLVSLSGTIVLAAGVAALAQLDEGDVFTGCVNNQSGFLSKVAVGFEPAKPCNPEEHQITWDRAGPAFEGRIAALEERVAELEAPFGTLELFVDCGAGDTIGDALAEAQTHAGPVRVAISGVCEENVGIGRDDVTLFGLERSDGIHGLSTGGFPAVLLHFARRVGFSNMTISGGNSGMLAYGSSFEASNVTIRDTRDRGIVAYRGSTGDIRDCTITGHPNGGVNASTESFIEIANCEISHNVADGVNVGPGGGSIIVKASEIFDNETGAVVYPGCILWLTDTLVANNQEFGVLAFGGDLMMDGATRIVDNGLSGVSLGTGAIAIIGPGPVLVEGNGDGIAVEIGSALRADALIVRNNNGNGITISDLSTMYLSPGGGVSQIVDNDGWGISCEGPPPVAVLGGQVFFNPSTIMFSGNDSGPTNCQ